MVWSDHADRDDVFGRHDDRVGGRSNHGIEIATGQRIGEIAEIVREERTDECEIRAQRNFQQEFLAVDRELLLAGLDDGADTGRRKDAAKPEAAGANAFDQGSLRYQLDLHLAADHALLSLQIGSDVADNRLA